ncbi:MAG: SpoIIE family protein phosphatase [Phycisphaerales bacterium]|nr:MAG: SpoIIE family protein phosphatase [Phycisphaerales bacterium]
MKKTKRQIERDEQLYQLTTLVAGEFSLQEVLDRLAEAAVKIVRVKACSIRLLDEETNDLKMRSTYGLSEEYRNKGVVSKDDPVVAAAFAGEAVVLDDMRVDGRVEYKDATIAEGLVSQLTVAMQFRNKSIGVLRLYSPKPKHFDQDDISLARAVASQCAVAITNAKLYAEAVEGARIAEQMRLAGAVQRRMIPKEVPRIPGLDVAATYIPCFDVGGDFYEFLEIDENRIGLTIADVIGKGVPAAIMMSWFRGAVGAYTNGFRQALQRDGHVDGDRNSGPRTAIRTRNAIVNFNRMACSECRDGEFITLFYATVDVKDRSVTYCSCGHEPAALVRNGEIIDLDAGGLVLGVDAQAEYEIETVALKERDCLLLYTDGLIDAVNFNGEMWGRERMLDAVKNSTDRSAEHMIRNILRYRRRFVGLARQIDDTSIIAVKVGGR